MESLRAAFCIPALDDQVPALHVSELPEALEQCVIEPLVSVCDKPHPPGFARLLRARHERPSSCPAAHKCNSERPIGGCAAQQRYELAAPHVEHRASTGSSG